MLHIYKHDNVKFLEVYIFDFIFNIVFFQCSMDGYVLIGSLFEEGLEFRGECF